jgi:FlaA1/EpsC-like NDP-sugar epimerase
MTRNRIDELLSGAPVSIPPDARVVSLFKDATVLVTGAAGSVGSELCRQALLLPMRRLIAFDRDENGIFELLSDLQNDARVTCVIGDIRDAERVSTLFAEHRPDITLHAAAYKHVSVMEQNESEAVLNNVTGTRVVAEAQRRLWRLIANASSSSQPTKPSTHAA